MNKNGPIIIIEDDEDDQEIFEAIFKKLDIKNELLFFSDGFKALEVIGNSDIDPFLILSDTNLPALSGYELREKVRNNQQLSERCTPYLLFTTAASHKAIVEAYCHSVQGFFVKPLRYDEFEKLMGLIVSYWKECTA